MRRTVKRVISYGDRHAIDIRVSHAKVEGFRRISNRPPLTRREGVVGGGTPGGLTPIDPGAIHRLSICL